jgi:hypothetical protein
MTSAPAIKTVTVGRDDGARSTTLEACRSLVGDEPLTELPELARELSGGRRCPRAPERMVTNLDNRSVGIDDPRNASTVSPKKGQGGPAGEAVSR